MEPRSNIPGKPRLELVPPNAYTPSDPERQPSSGYGGGGGGGDGMEARVAKLESELHGFRLETTKAFGDVKATLAAIEERTKHMPTRWEAFLIVAAVVGFVGTVLGFVAKFH